MQITVSESESLAVRAAEILVSIRKLPAIADRAEARETVVGLAQEVNLLQQNIEGLRQRLLRLT